MATKGHSTKLKYGEQGATPTYTDLGKVIDITPPAPEAEEIDISTMDSEEQWKEVTAGWADGGEVEVTARYDKAKNAAVYALFRADKAYQVEFSDGSTWSFNGFLKKIGNEVERQGIVTIKLTLRVSGKPVFAAAA
jgi:hypothetical protein